MLNSIASLNFFKEINSANRITIISHQNPDPDTLGANLALKLFLLSCGKTVESFCRDQIPAQYLALINSQSFSSILNAENFDLIISVDCSSLSQTFFLDPQKNPQFYQSPNPPKTLNLDHHASNNHFGSYNFVDLETSSTCEVLANLLIQINFPFSSKIAGEISSALLFGVIYDTGFFQHSNTSSQTLEIASKLINSGANLKKIIDVLTKHLHINKLKLWGNAFLNTVQTRDNQIESIIPLNTLKTHNCIPEDTSGLVSFLNSIPNVNLSKLTIEHQTGEFKTSLRTNRNDLDVSAIAKNYNGGGHKKAAGFSQSGKFSPEVLIYITP